MIFFTKEKLKQMFAGGGKGNPSFYALPQTYAVQYETAIKNTTGETSSFSIIVPVPSDTHYQKILKEPQFFPKGIMLGQDTVFGNTYGYWTLELAPGAEKIMREEFMIQVKPRIKLSRNNSDRPKTRHPGAQNDKADVFRVLGRSGLTNSFIHADDPRIKELAAHLKREETDTYKIIQRFNEYAVSHLTYGDPIKGLYSSRDALDKQKVDCGGFNTLLAALCIASGIPARIVSGFWAGYEKNTMHTWLEILLPDGAWIPADPSVEHLRRTGRTKKEGGLNFLGSDRIALSFGCGIPLIVEGAGVTVDILQNPVVVPDKGKNFLLSATFFTRTTSL